MSCVESLGFTYLECKVYDETYERMTLYKRLLCCFLKWRHFFKDSSSQDEKNTSLHSFKFLTSKMNWRRSKCCYFPNGSRIHCLAHPVVYIYLVMYFFLIIYRSIYKYFYENGHILYYIMYGYSSRLGHIT